MSSPGFIVFGAPAIDREEIDEVVRCLESGWIGTGPRVAQFEKEFAAYKSRPFAAAVSSCTAAMHLSVLAAGIDEGDKHYFVVEAGFKYNMMDLQAALGIHQLRRVESNWRRRAQIWKQYNEAFAHLPVTLPAEPEPNTRHAYHLYTILIDEADVGITRDHFLEGMTANNIGVGVHYLSVPEHPVYQEKFGWQPEDYPIATRIGRQTVSLPLSAKLTDAEVARVIEAVKVGLRPKSEEVRQGIKGQGLKTEHRDKHNRDSALVPSPLPLSPLPLAAMPPSTDKEQGATNEERGVCGQPFSAIRA